MTIKLHSTQTAVSWSAIHVGFSTCHVVNYFIILALKFRRWSIGKKRRVERNKGKDSQTVEGI